MKFTSGLSTNTGAIDQRAGTWRGGRNLIVSKEFGALTNEEGFDLIIVMTGTIIGSITLDSELVMIFQKRDTFSEIFIVDLVSKTKTLIASNTIFGFNPAFPISGEYYRNSKGQIVASWTDNNMPPRVMNIEVDYGAAIGKLTRLYLQYNLPKLTSSMIQDSSGSLLTGAYFIATRYVSIDQSTTSFSKALGPFYVNEDFRSNVLTAYDGAPAGQTTSKSLRLEFTGIDTDYRYMEVALVSKISGVLTAKLVHKLTIQEVDATIVIAGGENLGVVAIEEIVSSLDVFDKVKSMTQLQNQLLMANLSKEEEVDYQLAALDIVVNYGMTVMDIASTAEDNPKLNNTRGLMHNEVYMINIHYVKPDGTMTKGFHIPGRAVAIYSNLDHAEFAGVRENVSANLVATGAHIDRAVSIGGADAKIFQFFNTANNPNASTNMQYHENINRIYPDSESFGSLRNQPIRHHKFPSLGHIKNKYFASDNEFGKSKLTRLTLNLSNVTLPSRCVGYFISVAKRDFNNSSILAQDMMLFVGKRIKNVGATEIYWSTSGNWEAVDMLDTSTGMPADANYIRMHSFDLLLNRPTIAPNYVEAEIILKNRDISIRYDFTNKTGGSILQSGGFYLPGTRGAEEVDSIGGAALTDIQKRQDLIRLDYTQGNVVTQAMFPTKRFSKASLFKYLPNNVNDLGIFINLCCEECAVLKLDTGSLYGTSSLSLRSFSAVKNRFVPQFVGGVGSAGVPEETTYLFNIKQHKTDVYDLFNETLFLLSPTMLSASTVVVEGGDVIVSDMSFWTYGPRNSSDTDPNQGIRVARRHVVESINFASFRHEILGDDSTLFYPRTDVIFLTTINKSNPYNRWKYNSDYTSVDDINFLEVNDPIANLDSVTKFPYRIIRSKIQQVENKGINNWRTFPVNDYYEMPKVRGEITNIQGAGDNLIINQRYSLSRTRNKIKLSTSVGDVVAGTGDIFELPPEEMVPASEGFAGCQHKFSCLLTKNGYFFIDSEQGKIFLLQNKLEEISVKDNAQFFFNNLKGVNDNPYNGTGFTVGYDVKYNRLILTKKGGFTMSYSFDIDGGAWAFNHDYTPDYMFHTRTGLFTLNANRIFKHGSETKRGIYYDNTIYPAYVVGVFNDPKQVEKYYIVMKWRLEIRKLDGSFQRNETLTNMLLWNSYQATNEIDLTRYLMPSLSDYNVRKTGGIWRFNHFRDLVIDNTLPFIQSNLPITGNIDMNKPLQLKRRLIDNYLIAKFQYDNQPIDGEQRNLYLYEIDCDSKSIER